MIKILKSVLVAVAVTMAAAGMQSCGKDTDGTSSQTLEFAADCGRRDATLALKAEEGTMAREKAILEIRATETAMRDAGYERCADSYAHAAEETLFPSDETEE